MNLSQKTKNYITILGAVVGIIGIALTGITIGQSIGSENQQIIIKITNEN
ncbi:hypothetical protein [Paraclostridium sordellii]|nr:hypothetical protein [Paeniclostridium sordellii]CEP43691.1 Uncharacterised protein [[Clostridium] sordellii] [Paeniclostridium sordellii]CEP50460.1 Uncharacterised protein [[Clostridium] sordellii] [Paeniclostridium sordellii]